MTARIAGFVTRDAAGLVRPRSVSRRISPGEGGVALHYGGPPQGITDHEECVRIWRAWQRFHMGVRGWVDIAYTGGFCQHGYAFAGRGVGVRTAANGTNEGNANFYAVTWIGGDGEVPTEAAFDAAEWWVAELRRVGGAGRRVRAHRFFKGTACPGPHLAAYAARLDGANVYPAPPKPPTPPKPPGPRPNPKDDEMDRLPVLRRGAAGQHVRNLQGLLLAAGRPVKVDGIFGAVTETHLREWQRAARAPGGADGVAGPGTWGRLLGLR